MPEARIATATKLQPNERQHLTDAARKAGATVSEYLRSLVVKDMPTLKAVTPKVGKKAVKPDLGPPALLPAQPAARGGYCPHPLNRIRDGICGKCNNPVPKPKKARTG